MRPTHTKTTTVQISTAVRLDRDPQVIYRRYVSFSQVQLAQVERCSIENRFSGSRVEEFEIFGRDERGLVGRGGEIEWENMKMLLTT